MGYLDGLAAASFKKDAAGRDLFFLWGKLGKGRIVPSQTDGLAARRYLKIYYLCVLVGIVPMVMIGGHAFDARWLLTLGVFVALALAALVPLWLRAREWPLATERLTFGESVSASAKAHSGASLSVLIVLGMLLTVGSLLVLMFTDKTITGLVRARFLCRVHWHLRLHAAAAPRRLRPCAAA